MTVEEQYKVILKARQVKIALLELASGRIEEEYKDALARLEVRCLAEGGHVDDGGMFVGLCKRCGYCFG